MPSKQVEKIYIDSNVWFSYITRGKYDPHFEKADVIIDSINRNSDRVAIISQLSLLELVNSIRNRVVIRAEYQGGVNENPEVEIDLKNKIDQSIKDIMDIITKWVSSGKLRIVDVKTPMTEILVQAQLFLNKTFGVIKDHDRCKACKNTHYGYEYKGVDHWDIQHALIAKEANVNTFVTFDHGFNDLRQYFGNDYRIIVK
jgi:predicted nucleic acid-binding protein